LVREPNERDAWVADAQRWITDITGVKQCRINLDNAGEIQEILVVAGVEKAPRRVVRDVETVLKARTDMAVDYKKISVAQTIDNLDGFGEEDSDGEVAGEKPLEAELVEKSTAQATHHDTRHYFEDIPQDQATGADAGGNAVNVLDFQGPHAPIIQSPSNSASSNSVSSHQVQPDLNRTKPGDESQDLGGRPQADHLSQEAEINSSRTSTPESLAEPIPAVILAEEIAPRLICQNVAVMVSDLVIRAEVHLQASQIEALGAAEGANHPGADVELVARATLEAVAQFLIDPVLLQVQEVREERLGNQRAILTAINLVEGRRSETLLGACSMEHNRQQAVVHSVLDALNRRLSLMALKTAQAAE